MVFRRPKNPGAARSTAGESSNLSTTNTDDAFSDDAGKNNANEPADTYVKQSTIKVVLLLVSVFLSMFLVALDRVIISTVRFA
jgi:hypothetical protein